MARTYLVDPNDRQKAEYLGLLAAMEAAAKALVPGAPCSAAHAAAVQSLEARVFAPSCAVSGLSAADGYPR